MKTTRNSSYRIRIALLFIPIYPLLALGQDCTTKLIHQLQNIKGGFYANQTVTLTSKDRSKKFEVPCETAFDLKISNYTHDEEAISGKQGSQIKKEPNLQFVFFNDGDNKSDSEKKIGSTGGIYYQKSSTLQRTRYDRR